jgi:hypothetical protein
MIGRLSGENWAEIGLILAVLFICGLGYNALVAHAERRSWTRGYLALFVAGGVLITLAGVAVWNWRAAVITLCAFCASGAPMLIGSVYRNMIEREAELEAMRRDARRMTDDSTQEAATRR